jgi:hypothetical protein
MDTPQKFCKTPAVVEAIRYTGTNEDAVTSFMGGPAQVSVTKARLPGPGRGTHEGIRIRALLWCITADVGDWIVSEGAEFITCDPESFVKAYERIPREGA